MKIKKVLSLLTAMVMTLSILSVSAFAATPTPENCTMVVTTEVEGDAADTQEIFIFTISIPGDAPAEREFTVSKTGASSSQIHANESCSVTLKHNEHFTINGPANTAIEIVQSNNTGYTVRLSKFSSEGAPGETVESNEFNSTTFNGTLSFTNTKDAPTANAGVTKVTGDPIYTLNTTLVSNKADSTAVAPKVKFDITMQPAAADQLTGDIKAGPALPEGFTIPSVEFNADGTETFTAGKISKDTPIDFTSVTFPSAGTYRYVVTKSAGYVGNESTLVDGILDNVEKTMYLDVYVENTDTEGTYKVAYFVSSIPDAGKTEGFENEYDSFDFTLTNATTGSAGDKEKDFTYTVVFDATTISGANIVTTKNGTNEDITVADDKLTYTVLLKDGEIVNFDNVPKDAKYTITRAAAEGYTTTITAAGDDTNGAVDNDTYKFDESTDGITGSTQVTYTNNKEGVLPTGIILATVVPTVFGVVAIGGIGALIAVKKKDRD